MTLVSFYTRIASLFLFLAIVLPLDAAHLIGGVITYECLGDGDTPNTRKFQLYMRVYRDCAGGGADFDSAPSGAFPATITIYQGDMEIPFKNISLDAPEVVSVDPNDENPCVITPPNVCVQEGVYIFPVVELPIINGSYFISYQRCCRNGTITNINRPGETGVTYSVEISATAQEACNNSPVFNNFPPPIVCVGEPLNFDHTASDVDGDSLVYEFCTPLRGGGINSGSPDAQNGIAPNPDAPPPYAGVGFLFPNFSFQKPLGSEANLNIDPITGLLTGTPTEQGQYVVGICVSEYRDGALLSTVRRDFQFNVAFCEPTVVANLQSDVATRDSFTINSCGSTVVNFINQSTIRSFINEQYWQFFIQDDTVRIDTWDATVDFSEIGNYQGRLILNPNTNCGDTAYIDINIFEKLEVDFDVEIDSCSVKPIKLTNLSSSAADSIQDILWDYGNGIDTSQVSDHEYLYPEAGTFDIQLRIIDSNNCVERATKTINYYPVPENLTLSTNTNFSCVPADIFFENLSTPIAEIYDIEWKFGDGGTSNQLNPVYVYEEAGLYSVDLSITSPIGCQINETFTDFIQIDPSPVADFTYSPDSPSNFNPTVMFSDQSSGAVEWFWQFGDIGSSMRQNPVFTFPDTGAYAVKLLVTHQSGCIDTIAQTIDINPQVSYWLPNAFTPNNDNKNDVFQGKGIYTGMIDFQLEIYNRWGQIVFTTNDPTESWNGQYQNTGKLAMNGVYVYVLQYTTPRGKRIDKKGTMSLIR